MTWLLNLQKAMMDETSEANMLPLDGHLVVINTTVQSPENPNKINQQTQGPCDMMSTGWQFPQKATLI